VDQKESFLLGRGHCELLDGSWQRVVVPSGLTGRRATFTCEVGFCLTKVEAAAFGSRCSAKAIAPPTTTPPINTCRMVIPVA
jgi:hypothetical protein